MALFKTGTITSPAGTGNQSYTGVGFTPKLLIFFSAVTTGDGNATTRKEMLGAASGASNEASQSIYDQDAQGVTNASRRINKTKCITVASGGEGAAEYEADLVSMDSDGFTLNWAITAGSGTEFHYIAIGGADVSAKVATYNVSGSGNQSVTGVGFQPDILMMLHTMDNTTDTVQGWYWYTFGAGISSSSRFTINEVGTDGADISDNNSIQRSTKIIDTVHNGSSVTSVDLVSMDSDGFTVNNSVISQTPTIIYIAIKGVKKKIGAFNQATSTGNQSTTGVGFAPDLLILTSWGKASSTSYTAHSMRAFGAATSSSDRRSISGAANDNVGTSEADRRSDKTKAITILTAGTPTVNAEADFVSKDADGFTLNWTTVDATAREIYYIALAATGPAVSDSVTVTESVNVVIGEPYFITVSDSVTVSESVSTALVISLPGQGPLSAAKFRGIDQMKYTKDVVRSQPTDTFIYDAANFVAQNFNISHIAISIPMDLDSDYTAEGVSAPSPRTVNAFIQFWADTIHAAGKKVLWRMPYNFMEKSGATGLYDFIIRAGATRYTLGTIASAPTDGTTTLYGRIYKFINDNPTFFETGDIWAPFPERTENNTSQRTIASLTRSGSTATANTSGNHDTGDNQPVVVSGATQTEYNGDFQINKVDDDTFEYTVSGTPATPATGSPIVRFGVSPYEQGFSFFPHTGGAQAGYAAFFVDLATVSRNAFIANNKNVYVGLSAQNWSEIDSGWLQQTIFDTFGITSFDHYGTEGAGHSVAEMEGDWDDTYTNVGNPMFHQEWSDYWNGTTYDATRRAYLRSMYAAAGVRVANGKLIGFNYWGGWDGGTGEQILSNSGTASDPIFSLLETGTLLQEAFNGTADTINVYEYVKVSMDNTLSINVTDTVTLTESVSMFSDMLNKAVSDNVTISESVKVELTSFISVSENITVSESIGITRFTDDLNITVSDTVTITESTAFFTDILYINTTQNVYVFEGENQVPNYSFEIDSPGSSQIPTSWTAFGTAPDTYRGVANDVSSDGTQSFKVSSTINVDTGIRRNITGLTPGVEYVVSVWGKSTAAVDNAAFVLSNEQNGSGGSVTTNNSWSGAFEGRRSITFTAQTSAYEIFLGIGAFGSMSDGTAWFDDVKLQIWKQLDIHYPVTVSDSITLTETTDVDLLIDVNKSETITVSESSSVAIEGAVETLSISVSDTITITENVDPELVSFITVSDSITVTENIDSELVSFITVSDSITVTENIDSELVSDILVSDTVTITEAINIALTLQVSSPALYHSNSFSTNALPADWAEYGGSWSYSSGQAINTGSAVDPSHVLYQGFSTPSNRVVQIKTTITTAGWARRGVGIHVDSATGRGLNLLWRPDNGGELAFLDDLISWGPTTAMVIANSEVWIFKAKYQDGVYYGKAWKESDIEPVWQLSWTRTVAAGTKYAGILGMSSGDSGETAFDDFILTGLPDEITVTENKNIALVHQINVSDSIAVSESVALLEISDIAVSDSITLSESIIALLTSFLVIGDTVTITENSIILLLPLIGVSDTVTLTENNIMMLDLNVVTSENITVTEDVTVIIGSPSATMLQVADSIAVTEAVTIEPLEMNISVSDTVTITESVNAALVHLRSIEDTVTLDEAVNLALVHTIAAQEDIEVTENVVMLSTLNLAVSDSITLTESVGVALSSPSIAVSEDITITESVTLLIPELCLSVSDEIEVTDTPALQGIVPLITVSDNITVSENISMFTDILYLAVSDTITVSDFILFQSEYNKNQPFYYYIGQNLSIMLGPPRAAVWGTNGRPQNPIQGEWGYNDELARIELWDGSQWLYFGGTPFTP